MKLMIASDIHGSAPCCTKMLEAFSREEADRLLLLGDILYHGPRNDLPEGYAPKEVIAMLNPMKKKLLCVRGSYSGGLLFPGTGRRRRKVRPGYICHPWAYIQPPSSAAPFGRRYSSERPYPYSGL